MKEFSDKFIHVIDVFSTIFAKAWIAGIPMGMVLAMMICLVGTYGVSNDISIYSFAALAFVNYTAMNAFFDREFNAIEAQFPVFIVLLFGEIYGQPLEHLALMFGGVSMGLGAALTIGNLIGNTIKSAFDSEPKAKNQELPQGVEAIAGAILDNMPLDYVDWSDCHEFSQGPGK